MSGVSLDVYYIEVLFKIHIILKFLLICIYTYVLYTYTPIE